MKRILLSVTLCMLVTLSFGQKKAVKEAKSSMNSKNYTEARDFIKPALTNPETANDPETWKVAGDIENKAFDDENAKVMLRQSANDEVMYNGLLNSYAPYIKADELGELPDEKGKVKNKYRKDIIAIMRANHPYFSNGGIHYYNNKDYKKAGQFFEIYWNLPTLAMFEGDKNPILLTDSTSQIIKYYAVSSAILNKDHQHAIDLLNKIVKEPFAANEVYTETNVFELIAGQYLELKDSTNYVKALEEGAKKYPKSNFFITNLVNSYIQKKQPEQALEYLDKAIENDPSSSCEFNSAKGQIYASSMKFAEAEASYEASLEADPACERATEGLALVYIVQAQELKGKAGETSNRKEQAEFDAKADVLYKKSLPLLEKYKEMLIARKADDVEMKQAYIKLRNVYYNLNMNAEYEAANKEVEKK